MSTPHYILLNRQIPEYVRENFPVFVDFVKTYYKYLDQAKASQKIENLASIQNTLSELIIHFKNELGAAFPTAGVADERFVLERINEFYKTKGSIESFEFLFRVFFNEDVTVQYPWDNVLIASDGRWYQESFITVTTTDGTIPTSSEFFLDFKNNSGAYRIQIIRHEVVDPVTRTYRLYFISTSDIVVVDNQTVTNHAADGVNINWRGTVLKSPNYLKIITPGQNWQIGQVVVIEGTIKDTIAKVTSIDSLGGVTGIEIVQYGYSNTENEVKKANPYPYKPIGATYDQRKTITGVSPLTYLYEMSITDYVYGLTEHVMGVSDALNADSYFLEQYVERGYSGELVINASVNEGGNVTELDTGITIDTWLKSTLYVQYVFANITKTKGSFTANNGLLSNQNIRLEDNFYYQRFSYDIQSVHTVDEYKVYTDFVHPGGTKQFSTLVLSPTIELDITYDISVPTIKEFLLDETSTDDSVIDFIFNRVVDLSDGASTTDSLTTALTKNASITGDSVTASESLTMAVGRNKYLNDSVTTADDGTNSIKLDPYDGETYFGENYVTNTYTLTIGP
jgi:hypothetical protein